LDLQPGSKAALWVHGPHGASILDVGSLHEPWSERGTSRPAARKPSPKALEDAGALRAGTVRAPSDRFMAPWRVQLERGISP